MRKCEKCKYCVEKFADIPTIQGAIIYWCTYHNRRIGAWDYIQKRYIPTFDVRTCDNLTKKKKKKAIIWKKKKENDHSFILENEDYLIKGWSGEILLETNCAKIVVANKKNKLQFVYYLHNQYFGKLSSALLDEIEYIIKNMEVPD